MPENCSNRGTVALISLVSKVCSKSFKLDFNSMWSKNFQTYKLDLEKAEEPEIKLPISIESWKKLENSRKTATSASLTTLKPLPAYVKTKLWEILRDGNTRPHYLPPAKPVCRSRSNSYNQTWNNGLFPNWERSMSRLYFVTPLV